jgi:Sec7 domain/PH domain
VRKNWKRRWFVLTSTSIRYYSKETVNDVSMLKGVIPLRGCRMLDEGSDELRAARRSIGKRERSQVLVLHLENGTNYYLLASSESEYDEWRAHIDMLISHSELEAGGGGGFASDVSVVSPGSSFVLEEPSPEDNPVSKKIMESLSSDDLAAAGRTGSGDNSRGNSQVSSPPGTWSRNFRPSMLIDDDAGSRLTLAPSWGGAEEDEARRASGHDDVPFVRNIHIGSSRSGASRLSTVGALSDAESSREVAGPELDEAATAKLAGLDPEEALSLACRTFNSSPRKGVATLLAANLVGNTPDAVALFLLHHSRADGVDPNANISGITEDSSASATYKAASAVADSLRKKRDAGSGASQPLLFKGKVGDYLGEPGAFERKVLRSYVRQHVFAGLAIVGALRKFLENFRLPGEAQKIDRIMEEFAEWFCLETDDANGVFKTRDAAYILAFSLIMLNTDAHNDSVKHKMTKEQFRNNNRGINAGEDLPADFLNELFDEIVENEIVLESDSAEREDFSAWEHQGWLNVKTSSSWVKKYCILAGNCLYVFERPTNSDPPEVILPLMNVVLELPSGEGDVILLRSPDRRKLRARRGNKEVSFDKILLGTDKKNFRSRFEWTMRLRLSISVSPTYQGGATPPTGSGGRPDTAKKSSPYGKLPFVARRRD